MARGILYHATTDSSNINSVDASDFTGSEREFSIEYFINRRAVDAQSDIEALIKQLNAAGFTVTKSNNCYILKTGRADDLNAIKVKYFEPYLNETRKRINEISPKTFATDPNCTYDLMCNIDDRYSNAVAFDKGDVPVIYTMMQFIRRLEPDTIYFISSETILMH